MLIETIRFGSLEVDETRLITFDDGLPGLEEYKSFAVLHIEESFPIIWMQCVTEGGIALPVIETFKIDPDYAFDIDEEDVRTLGLENPEDVQVVSILRIPDNIEQTTINLAAPVIINTRTGKAKQIFLAGSDYGVRTPAFHSICRLLKEEEPNAGAV